MIIKKIVGDEIVYNDGDLVEIQTFGVEGIATDILLNTIQIDRSETGITREDFLHEFPVGTFLKVSASTEY